MIRKDQTLKYNQYNLRYDDMQQLKKSNPLRTRTGKLRLGPMSAKQLIQEIEKTNKPKMKHRYRTRLAQLQKRGLA